MVTDITGKSGRALLDALLQGQQDPEVLAELARGRLRSKRDELAQAVQGTLSEHHRFLLKSQLRRLDFFDGQVAELDREIAHRLGVPTGPDEPDPSTGQPAPQPAAEAAAPEEPSASAPPRLDPAERHEPLSPAQVVRILDEVTGINVRMAQIVVAELGPQLSQVPDEAHLVCLRGAVSSNQDQCRQTAEHHEQQRQSLAASSADSGRPCCRTQQRHLPGGILSPAQQAHGGKESDRRPRSSHSGDHLSSAQRPATLPRTGTRPCRGASGPGFQTLGHSTLGTIGV